MSQPIPHQFESFVLNSVNTLPALPLMRNQTSGLKDLKMSRCRLPRMLEDRRYFSGCHGATVEVNRE
jgi:hypothetical protein